MPPSVRDAKNLFHDSPSEIRRLVFWLYALAGPVFVVVLYLERNPDRGLWEIPTIAALLLIGGLFLRSRPEPRPADWLLPIAIVPTLCIGIAAASCGDRGGIYLAVITAPLAGGAVLCETFVVQVAWGVATATSLAVLTHMFSLPTAIAGTTLFATVNGLVAWTVHGKAQAIRGLHAELADRKQAELRVARLAGLEQRINEIEFVMSVDGRIVSANDRAALAYGYSRSELLQRGVRDLRDPDTLPPMSEQFAKLRAHGSVRFETQHRRKDGSLFPVLVSSRTFQVDGETFVHCLIHDLTEEHRLRDRLLRSQKMESIGRLAGSVAHDFNNLLTVIQSYSAMLEADLPADDPHHLEVAEIHAAATRATALTRRLLAASRRQIRAPREVDLGEVIRASEPMLRSLLGPGVDLSLDLPATTWTAHLDRAQIDVVLQNLAANARAAMPSGGALRVSVSDAANPIDPDVFGEPPPPGDYVVLTVADTGRGIDAATRDHLFEPGLTTRDSVKTTGLGLAEVHGIVSQSSGHVAVTSAPGKGTAFRFYFPRFRPLEAPKLLPEAEARASGGGPTILVVDDDAEVRAVTRRLLSRAHYTILEASDGDEALNMYSLHRAEISLILTDVAMPRLSGPELVAQLDASGQRRPPVIFMSAYVDSASLGMDKLPPSSAFIAKPFDKASLLAMIASALPPVPRGAAAA